MVSPLRLPHQLDRQALTCRAIVETPRGARAKLRFDEEAGLFELGKILPAGMAFPFAFGFIPSTRAEDGDPLDIIILGEADLPAGCLVTVRLVGVTLVEQRNAGEEEWTRNDRLLGRLTESVELGGVDTLGDLPPGFLDEASRFFTTYKELRGQSVRLLGDHGPDKAVELIDAYSRA